MAKIESAKLTDSERQTAFSSLHHRDFRLLWMGQIVSVTGSQMQLAAINWHIYLLTRSPLALGLVGACRAIPIILCSLVGGVVADVVDRRRMMMATQSVMLTCSAALALVTFRGLLHVWPIFLLTAIASAAWAFDTPARQARSLGRRWPDLFWRAMDRLSFTRLMQLLSWQ